MVPPVTRLRSFLTFGVSSFVLAALVGCDRPGDQLVVVDQGPSGTGATSTGSASSVGGSDGVGGSLGGQGGEDSSGGTGTGASSGSTGGSGGSSTSGKGGTLILLIERSSSMASGWEQGSDSTSRWDLVREALFESGGPVAENESKFSIGLVGFTATDNTCPSLDNVELAAASNNAEALAAAAAAATPQEDPKGESTVGEAVAYARGLFSGVTGKKDILLVTDGEPDTCANRDPQCGHDVAIEEIQAAVDAGITVTVVGVGDENPTWYLQGLANAGAGQPVAELGDEWKSKCEYQVPEPKADYAASGGTARYYQPTDPSGLRSAFEEAFDAILAR